MNPEILNPEVQEFINANLREDITRILLKKSPFENVTSKELAGQIESKVRCEKKLPTWFNSPGIYYPPRISIEQASSEETARYKSAFLRGNNIIDLTGGFGVDSFYFAKEASNVIHCESNKELSEIAAHNASVLGITNIRFIQADGMAYLRETHEEFDTIYVDPSRRVNSRKVFRLADCEPDVASNLDLLRKKASRVLLKTSPLLDIQAGLNELDRVTEIQVVSLGNDCKELLWTIDRDIKEEDVKICCTSLEPLMQYRFSLPDERNFRIHTYSVPLRWIYEPDVSLLKAGCFKLITRDFNLKKLNINSHLYTSDEINNTFIGRIFQLKSQWSYKNFLSSAPVSRANIISRNFPLTADEIKRQSKLKDGGDEYLIFTKGPSDELLVLNCERIQ